MQIELLPAARLLFLCARTRLEEATLTQLQDLVRSGVDWEWAIRHARVHRITPLVYASLRTPGVGDIPSRVIEQLHSECQEISRRNLVRTGELIKILQAFDARQIPIIPLKGPTLAVMAYNNLSLREFVDLDLLVPPNTMVQARETLHSMGFLGHFKPGSAAETACEKLFSEMMFTRQESIIDLHWNLAPPGMISAGYQRDIFQNLKPITIAGVAVNTFSPEDLLLFLCFHGSKMGHHWRRLSWICDVSELLRAFPGLDWDIVLRRAAQEGLQRSLHLGLYLAREWLDASVPEEIGRAIQIDAAIAGLAQQVSQWLFDPQVEAVKTFNRSFFYLGARERWRDRLRFLAVRVFWPTVEDWESAALPVWLYFFYRPFRLVGKFARKLVRRLAGQ
jgi:hypothetical protein